MDKFWISLFLAFSVLLGCSQESVSNDPQGENVKVNIVHVTDITLDSSKETIKEGETITLLATLSPENASNTTINWTSSDASVAMVESGTVIGIKAGNAIIIATSEDGGKTATCSITVERNLAPSVTVGVEHISAISAILMGKANLATTVASDLKIGFQYSKSAGILPSNSTTIEATEADSDYYYSIGITGLEPATTYYFRSFIRQNGADSYGETKSFSTNDLSSLVETKEASSVESTSAVLNGKLNLTDVRSSNVVYGFLWGLSESSLNSNVAGGDIDDNSYSAPLSNLSYKTQYWYKAYVTIDNVTYSGSVQAFSTTVVPVEGVVLDKNEHTFNNIGNSLALVATVYPEEANDKSISWSSDNDAVATVDENGIVTAAGNGTAFITVTTADQNKSAKCFITVAQHVAEIVLNTTEMPLTVANTAQLIAKVLPEDAKDKSILWSSSNESVAIVSSSGLVVARSKGSAIITATANDGSGVSCSCNIYVKNPTPAGAVDLGLRVDWAICNLCEDGFVGSPEQYGDYYVWGETEPYYSSLNPMSGNVTWKEGKEAGYHWAYYKWGTFYGSIAPSIYPLSCVKFTKYCPSNMADYWDGTGDPDNKMVLDLEDDAAHVKLGGSWRMPTVEEWTELSSRCTCIRASRNGVNGCLVTGPNGASIFLPSAGDIYETTVRLGLRPV